jgi:hypothetical protein
MYWGLAGIFIPLSLLAVARIQGGVFLWPYVVLFFWPTSIIAAAGDVFADPENPRIIGMLFVSIALNVLVYLVIGRLIWSIWDCPKER